MGGKRKKDNQIQYGNTKKERLTRNIKVAGRRLSIAVPTESPRSKERNNILLSRDSFVNRNIVQNFRESLNDQTYQTIQSYGELLNIGSINFDNDDTRDSAEDQELPGTDQSNFRRSYSRPQQSYTEIVFTRESHFNVYKNQETHSFESRKSKIESLMKTCYQCKELIINACQSKACFNCQDAQFCSFTCFELYHSSQLLYHVPWNVQDDGYHPQEITPTIISQLCQTCITKRNLPMTIVDFGTGSIKASVQICSCDVSQYSIIDQLIYVNLFPATPTQPRTCITVDTILLYQNLLTVNSMSLYSFWKLFKRYSLQAPEEEHYNQLSQAVYHYITLTQNVEVQLFDCFNLKCLLCKQNESSQQINDQMYLEIEAFTADLDNLQTLQPEDIKADLLDQIKVKSLKLKVSSLIKNCVRQVSLDGCFKMQHRRHVGGNAAFAYLKHFFIQEDISSQSLNNFEDSTCSLFEALQSVQEKAETQLNDVTGVFGAFCSRHGCPVLGTFTNILKGEKFQYADAALLNLLNQKLDGEKLMIFYDIACQYQKNIQTRLGVGSLEDLIFKIPNFHLYAHKKDCQFSYNSKVFKFCGCSIGEICETRWSYLGLFKFLKETKLEKRQDYLEIIFKDLIKQSNQDYLDSIFKRFKDNYKLFNQFSGDLQVLEETCGTQINFDNISEDFSVQVEQDQANTENIFEVYVMNLILLYEQPSNDYVQQQLAEFERNNSIQQRWHAGAAQFKQVAQVLLKRQMDIAFDDLYQDLIEKAAHEEAYERHGNTTILRQRFRNNLRQSNDQIRQKTQFINVLIGRYNIYGCPEVAIAPLSEVPSLDSVEQRMFNRYSEFQKVKFKASKLYHCKERCREEFVYLWADLMHLLANTQHYLQLCVQKLQEVSNGSLEYYVLRQNQSYLQRLSLKAIKALQQVSNYFVQIQIDSILEPLYVEYQSNEAVYSSQQSGQNQSNVENNASQQESSQQSVHSYHDENINEYENFTSIIDEVIHNINDSHIYTTNATQSNDTHITATQVLNEDFLPFEEIMEKKFTTLQVPLFVDQNTAEIQSLHMKLPISSDSQTFIELVDCLQDGVQLTTDVHQYYFQGKAGFISHSQMDIWQRLIQHQWNQYKLFIGNPNVQEFPYNLKGLCFIDCHQNHFTLYYFSRAKRQILFYNPLISGNGPREEALKRYSYFFRFIFRYEDPKLFEIINWKKGYRQSSTDNVNCGMFCLVIAEYLLNDEDSVLSLEQPFSQLSQRQIKELRVKVLQEIKNLNQSLLEEQQEAADSLLAIQFQTS